MCRPDPVASHVRELQHAKAVPMIKRSSDTSKILLLRVGMDLGFGGLGPLFPDGTFEYVPIPESETTERPLFFRDIPARSGGSVTRFVPARHRNGPAHYDPEFKTFTYGDPTKNKRGQLLRLRSGDILVFYAGLRPPEQIQGSKLYIIGYLIVRQIHAITRLTPWPRPEFERLWGNAHFRRNKGDEDLVVVEGDPARSRLLTRAVPLSDGHQDVLPEMTKLLGLSGSVKRSGAGRWVPERRVGQAARWLQGL
jgi:hypothetical protein